LWQTSKLDAQLSRAYAQHHVESGQNISNCNVEHQFSAGANIAKAPREADGRWVEPWFTAVGFPRVFYLRYHGYAAFFSMWALVRYRNLVRSNEKDVAWGDVMCHRRNNDKEENICQLV
jgi:squalene cyclase